MRILMIATGYPPYLFSENLCNGKLALALMENGIQVDVISRVDKGPSYGAEWVAPWDVLQPAAHIIEYKAGNKVWQMYDVLYSGFKMAGNHIPGVRWARRAYEKALQLIKENHYDAVYTRSPGDIPHLVGYMLKKKTGCHWIANWNDPADPIWPAQYKHNYSPSEQKKKMDYTSKLLFAADVNTFPSDSLRQHFIEWFPQLQNQKTTVLPHIGLVESAWPKGEPKINDGILRFLHSGNLSAERNPDTTFQALCKLIDNGFDKFEFHIMGHVNDYTKGLIEKYQLHDHVKFIGSFSYMEALAKMQAYDVLVLLEARLDKGIFFASKFTDYLQTGLPILAISPKQGFAVDTLKDQPCEYLADNTDVDAIYITLISIIENWRKGTLSQNASKKLYGEVSPEFVINIFKSLFQ